MQQNLENAPYLNHFNTLTTLYNSDGSQNHSAIPYTSE